MPSAKNFDLKRPTALRTGWREADVGRGARAAMLQQEAEVRGEGAEERKENAYFNSHVEGVRIHFGTRRWRKRVDGDGPCRYSRYRLGRLPLDH